MYRDSELSLQDSIDLECGDLSPLCDGRKRKRRQVAALKMVPELITHLRNTVSSHVFGTRSPENRDVIKASDLLRAGRGLL